MPDDLVPSGIAFLFFPVQGTFFNDIDKSSEEKADKHHNCHESIPSQTPEINCVGIKENNFNIKQNEKDGNQEILDGHGLTCITKLLDTTLKYLQLITGLALWPQELGSKDHDGHQSHGKQELDSNRKIVACSADLGVLSNGLRLQEKRPYHGYKFQGSKIGKNGM